MITVSDYLKKRFGTKVYRIALAGGRTCPNRDGTCGTRGCIFCSSSGSGDFVPSPSLGIDRQIDEAEKTVAAKGAKAFIAYFQSFTATYRDDGSLEERIRAALRRDEIVGVSVATRPDCLPAETIDRLAELNRIKPVWVELGLQTVSDTTAEYIRRGYPTSTYFAAVKALRERELEVITHIILGLPGESEEDMLSSVKAAVNAGSKGIKLQLLQILTDSDLYAEYLAGKVRPMEEDEYFSLLRRCLPLLAEDTVLYRLTGDGSKKTLAAPKWCADKRRVLNRVNALLRDAAYANDCM